MLRVEILPDGTQRIGDRELPVTVYDLRDLDSAAAEQRLDEIRDAKSHQLLAARCWRSRCRCCPTVAPACTSTWTCRPPTRSATATSCPTSRCSTAAANCPTLGYTYREYRAALTATSTVTVRRRPAVVGRARAASCRNRLRCRWFRVSEQADPRRSTRRWHIFDVAHPRRAVRRRAPARHHAGDGGRGVLRRNAWPGGRPSRRFLLNLPMFGREQFHPDVDKLVGDFTSSLMLDVDLTGGRHRRSSVPARLQETLHATAEHSSYSGLSVLRDLTRHRGTQTLAPIVLHQRARPRRPVRRRRHRAVRQAGVDDLAGPPGAARRPGDARSPKG